jgi:hypothetical protein
VTAAIAPLVREIEARARRDAGFLEVLDALLEAPTGPHGTLQHAAAHNLNEQRREAVVAEFVDGALPTSRVQALLGYASPQAVHRLRTRGRLIGSAVGNQTWFPAWQFESGRLRAELPRILELLKRYTIDPVAADRIMRLEHADLNGTSIADAIGDPTTSAVAWRMLESLGA